MSADDVFADPADETSPIRAAEAVEELAELLQNPKFIRFVRRLIDHTGYLSTAFDDNPYTMAAKAGRRDVGQWIISSCAVARPETQAVILGNELNQ